jgi:hypothetical protein
MQSHELYSLENGDGCMSKNKFSAKDMAGLRDSIKYDPRCTT